MAGSAARPERGNTKMAKNGPETTEQQRAGLGGRHGAAPMLRMSEAALSLADLFSILFNFFFLNYSTLGLFFYLFSPILLRFPPTWSCGGCCVSPRGAASCGNRSACSCENVTLGEKKIIQTHGENTGSCTREALWTPHIVLGCFFLFFFYCID